jgi:4-diphosphocytidyl-2-C-methyl-D-erythritol kinase
LAAARTLGADVPYFLFGGPALGLGRGDDIHPQNFAVKEKLLLVPGHGGVSTAAVFKRFGSLRARPRASRIDAFLHEGPRSPGRSGSSPRTLRNDLERAALAESASLRSIARKVRQVARLTGAHAAMSGSGSSFFMLFDNPTAKQVAEVALGRGGVPSVRCSFLSRRAYERRF